MKKRDGKFTIFTIISMALILSFTIVSYLSYPYSDRVTASFGYGDNVFDDKYVHNVDINVSEEDWQYLIDNPLEEKYVSCDIDIDGQVVKNVGIRPKGNSSLTHVAFDENTDRYSFKLNFDEYIDGQNYLGLNALILNNNFNDKSYMKEYVTYKLFEELGVPVPQTTFVNIKLNGENWGLYLGVEPMEESYLLSNFGSLDGNLYKPEVGNMGDRFNGDAINPEEGASQSTTNLTYIDDSIDTYSYLFNNTIIGGDNKRDTDVMFDFIKAINTDNNIDKIVDIDSVLKYTAVNAFVSNFDSYIGKRANNFYLYEENGKVSLLPWDLNLAFGGMALGNGSEAINFSILEPYISDESNYPLISNILKNEEYLNTYVMYVEQLINFVESGEFEELVLKTDYLINDYVKQDSTAFFNYEDYLAATPSLITYANDRAGAVENQLNGINNLVSTTFKLDSLIEGTKEERNAGDTSEKSKKGDGTASNKGGNIGNTSEKRNKGNETTSNKGGNVGDTLEKRSKGDESVPNKGGDSIKQPKDQDTTTNKSNNENSEMGFDPNLVNIIISSGIGIIALIFAILFKRKR